MRDTERERERERERQRHRQREKQTPCREPNVGLDPGSPGSCPGLQAALNHCTTGAAQVPLFLLFLFFFLKLYNPKVSGGLVALKLCPVPVASATPLRKADSWALSQTC